MNSLKTIEQLRVLKTRVWWWWQRIYSNEQNDGNADDDDDDYNNDDGDDDDDDDDSDDDDYNLSWSAVGPLSGLQFWRRGHTTKLFQNYLHRIFIKSSLSS